MAWTSPRTWVAAETVTAALMNTHVRDNLNAIGGTWTSYTPTLTNITLGNGALTASYLSAGNLVIGEVKLVAGSTTSFSAGGIGFTLPVSYSGMDASVDVIGWGAMNLNSNASRTQIYIYPSAASGTGASLGYTGGTVTNTAPLTLAATTTRIGFKFVYHP